MAGELSGEPGPRRVGAGRDAIVASRDVILQQAPPSAPSLAPPPRRAWVNVPARNPAFTGRDGLLARLRDALAAGDRAVVQEETLGRRRRVLGEDHPETRRSARNLAADIAALEERGGG